MIKRLNILCFALFVLVSFLAINVCYNNIINKSSTIEESKNNVERWELNTKTEDYCKKLLEKDLYSNSNKEDYNKNTCIEMFEYGDNFTISWLGSYYDKKSEILLTNFIKRTNHQFRNKPDFLKTFNEKANNLDILSQEIVNKEFPDPFEGSGTRLFRYNRFATLRYVQIDILKGYIAEYCLQDFENSCFYKIYDRLGKID